VKLKTIFVTLIGLNCLPVIEVNKGSKLLIADVENYLLIIKKINIEELAKEFEKDFQNIDIDIIVGKVQSDIKETIKKKHPSVFG